MKRLFLFLLMTSISTLVLAQQQGGIKVKFVDDRDGGAIAGVMVSMTGNDQKSRYNVADGDGESLFTPLTYGEYKMVAAFVGYDTIRKNITLSRDLVDVGTVRMKVQALVVEDVNIMGIAIRTSQSGDTVIYNADAFKVTDDAVAEALLAKMPGITVDDGEVEVQGEEVKKVFLDGKEFFGEDVSLAVKNIPADIIAKVEVFNKLSDNAEMTGFDDGDSYKAINIVTRTGMNKGQFGKFTAGYAYDNLYQVSASYNHFTDKHRFTVVANSNNMNIKGFSSMTVGRGGSGRSMTSGAGSFGTSSSGISTISGFGINYGGNFKEEKLKLEASYFYNMTDSESDSYTDRQYITDSDEVQRYYTANTGTTSNDYNHRVNAKLEYKPNNRHSLMIRPELAFQDSGSNNFSFEDNDESSDGISFSDLNNIESIVKSDKNAINVSNMMVYRAMIGNKGRNIMITANGSYSNDDSNSYSSYITSYPSADDSQVVQDILDGIKSYSINSSVTYSEPIFNKSAMLTLKYSINHSYSDADYLVYEWEQYENMFNPDYDPTSSNIYNSGYTTHNVGPGFMYSKKNSLQLNANVSYQSSALSNKQEVPESIAGNQRYSFNDFIYSMMMRKTFNPTNTLRLMLRSSTENPSVSNLQEVVKDSNPLSVSSGNSSLVPSYSHNVNAVYVRSNTYKGRTFMAMVSGGLTQNYIGDSTIMLLSASDSYILPNGEALEDYGEYTRPVNLDGKWQVNSSISYGTPITPLSSNLNLSGGVGYSETPSIFNGISNLNRTTTYKAGASLGSNISNSVDFTISYSGGYNIAKYKYDTGTTVSQNNEYLTQKASLEFKFVFWGGFTLFGNTTYSQYLGVTDDFNQQYVSSNLSIGRKIFSNKRGEISLGVNDIFNQSENFVRNITESYVENVTSNSIGRYYGIKFTFDLRKFNGSNTNMGRGPRGEDEGMGERPDRGMGGMGGGPGGMGGGPGGGGMR